MSLFSFNPPGERPQDKECRKTLDTEPIITSVVEHVNTNKVLVKGINEYNSTTSDVKQKLDIESLVSTEVKFNKDFNPLFIF